MKSATAPPPDPRRPVVAVSACLLGQPVRYDGSDKHTPVISDLLGAHFLLQPLCPEVGAGLGVPRPPIQVVTLAGEHRVRHVQAPHRDVTDAIVQYARQQPAHFSGMIVKARSPSCGLGTTPLHDHTGAVTGMTSGVFVQHIQSRFPMLPLCSEAALHSASQREAFVRQVHAYHQRHFLSQGLSQELS